MPPEVRGICRRKECCRLPMLGNEAGIGQRHHDGHVEAPLIWSPARPRQSVEASRHYCWRPMMDPRKAGRRRPSNAAQPVWRVTASLASVSSLPRSRWARICSAAAGGAIVVFGEAMREWCFAERGQARPILATVPQNIGGGGVEFRWTPRQARPPPRRRRLNSSLQVSIGRGPPGTRSVSDCLRRRIISEDTRVKFTAPEPAASRHSLKKLNGPERSSMG